MTIRNMKMEEELEISILQHIQHNHKYEYISPEEMKLSYNHKYAFDEKRLLEFIQKTQPSEFEKLRLDTQSERETFYKRLDNEIRKNGVVSVLKNGFKCYPSEGVTMFYHTLDPKRPKSYDEFNMNIFSVTNQLNYSDKNKTLALDLAIFINGLPVITIELKSRSSSTRWTYKNAEEQYKYDRDPTEAIFSFKRCIAHFAVDENFITFATHLDGPNTRFMPFNKGTETGGSGNPINPNGFMTDYLWKEFLSKQILTSLIRDFTYISSNKDNNETLIFPRYHQYRVVTRLLKDVSENGVGKRYLIQHSAGSGKSNSITWLAYRLVEASQKDKKIFDSVIVVTDRSNIDKQINENIRKFIDERNIAERAYTSTHLKDLLINGKKIIISTIQKFPFLLQKIGTDLSRKNFAIIIDEAHSSQSGRLAASLNMAVSGNLNNENDIEFEDRINQLIQSKQMPSNASFFAFTATPKAKTIEMFGSVFDLYSMKQAIEEGFILDVLKNYTQYDNYYKIRKKIEGNPDFDERKAQKKIRQYVERQKALIDEKSRIIVDHFLGSTAHKINGKAKAMVVTPSITRAIYYYYAIRALLRQINSDYDALVAFSGEKEHQGHTLTEASLNGFPDNQTVEKFKEDRYKFLIVADKYQTGYDEPLLHTMYVDKKLSDVKAVQTLSRLNRCAKYKTDTCIIDFANSAEEIIKSFQPYYKETKLENYTDPNTLYKMLATLDAMYVYEKDEIEYFVESFLSNQPRSISDNILDLAVERYLNLSKDNQTEFKRTVKLFISTYNFLSAILPVGQAEWEKKLIFFQQLINRLPSSRGEDLSEGILNSIDLESFRIEKKNTLSLILEDKDGEVEGLSDKTMKALEERMESLDDIVSSFNQRFGNIGWKDEDNQVKQNLILLEKRVMSSTKLKNAATNSDNENLKRELSKEIKTILRQFFYSEDNELFAQWIQNPEFSSWLNRFIFEKITKNN